ncbi:acyl carrier protein [Pseudoroseomonas wenyumeiae]
MLGALLGTGPVDPAAPFFDLGASSVTLVQLRNRLQAECGLTVPMAEMFGRGSVRLLAQWLEEAGAAMPARPGMPRAEAIS